MKMKIDKGSGRKSTIRERGERGRGGEWREGERKVERERGMNFKY